MCLALQNECLAIDKRKEVRGLERAYKTARRADSKKYGRLLRVMETKTMLVCMYERATVFVPISGRLTVVQYTSLSELPHGLRLDHIP